MVLSDVFKWQHLLRVWQSRFSFSCSCVKLVLTKLQKPDKPSSFWRINTTCLRCHSTCLMFYARELMPDWGSCETLLSRQLLCRRPRLRVCKGVCYFLHNRRKQGSFVASLSEFLGFFITMIAMTLCALRHVEINCWDLSQTYLNTHSRRLECKLNK